MSTDNDLQTLAELVATMRRVKQLETDLAKANQEIEFLQDQNAIVRDERDNARRTLEKERRAHRETKTELAHVCRLEIQSKERMDWLCSWMEIDPDTYDWQTALQHEGR